jgi:hypothetical protein
VYIYFIISESKLTKIGRTENVKRRFASIKSNNASRVALLFAFCADAQLEKILHHIFGQKRVQGEWFDLSTVDIKNVLQQIPTSLLPHKSQVEKLLEEIETWNENTALDWKSVDIFTAAMFRCESINSTITLD